MDRKDVIELPPELSLSGHGVGLAVDVLFIKNEAFLHAVDRTIKCPNYVVLGTVKKGKGYDHETLIAGIDEILCK